MRSVLRRPRSWLVLGWRAAARLARRTPPGHAARPYALAASRLAEDRYWRQVRRRRQSPRPVVPKWRA